MKEQIETIPVREAFDAGDECPFCYLERQAEERTIRYVAGDGASYMEPDVRGATDQKGFCREHLRKLYAYGNVLGCALMLQTHFAGILEDLEHQRQEPLVPQKGFFRRREVRSDSLPAYLEERDSRCTICDRVEYHMDRYYRTFFALLREETFRNQVAGSKGFCLHHYGALLRRSEGFLPKGQEAWFYATVERLMEENLRRVKGDLDHFISMFDYRSQGADWKQSRDAVPRTMQKLRGGYPADPPLKKK